MWASGCSAAGSSRLPTRTKRTSGRPPYSLQSAVWQPVQRRMWCGRPLSVGIATGAGSRPDTTTRSASTRALIANALPVWRWQSRQWQQCTNIGADVRR
jgi:hypothetical protein